MREIRFNSIQSVKMSLKVIKAGLLDSIQDAGRYGYQHLGINPGGVMDRYSLQAINILLSNSPGEAVIEMHFPAPAFLFEQAAMIALGGADFHATINGEPIPSWHPVIVNKNSVLHFEKRIKGGRGYLAVKHGFDIQPWLGSASTNLKAGAGGFRGRALQKEDSIPFKKKNSTIWKLRIIHKVDMTQQVMDVLIWNGPAINLSNIGFGKAHIMFPSFYLMDLATLN